MATLQATVAVQKLSFRMPLFTSRQFSVSSSSLRYKRAIMRREERKRRIKFYLPKKKSTISGKMDIKPISVFCYYAMTRINWERCGLVLRIIQAKDGKFVSYLREANFQPELFLIGLPGHTQIGNFE